MGVSQLLGARAQAAPKSTPMTYAFRRFYHSKGTVNMHKSNLKRACVLAYVYMSQDVYKLMVRNVNQRSLVN